MTQRRHERRGRHTYVYEGDKLVGKYEHRHGPLRRGIEGSVESNRAGIVFAVLESMAHSRTIRMIRTPGRSPVVGKVRSVFRDVPMPKGTVNRSPVRFVTEEGAEVLAQDIIKVETVEAA